MAMAAAVALAPVWGASAADDAAKLVDDACGSCHTPAQRPLEKMHLTHQQWADAVERMMGIGAEVPKKKVAELVDYLAKNHGPEAGDKK
jgi:hypothetical protein